MIQILLIILLLFIAIPIFRVGYRIWRLQRTMRRFMEDPIGTAQSMAEKQQRQAEREATRQRRRGNASSAGNRRTSTGNPIFDFFAGFGGYDEPEQPVRKKKIPGDVGEYVKFTEIKVTAQNSRQVQFTREEQVQDVEWEDIK